jgi:hypothetical protein
MIGEPGDDLHLRAELAQAVFKAFRHGDAGQGADKLAFQAVDRETLAGVDVFKVHGAVAALDDLGGAVVAADLLDEVLAVAVGLGDEDVAGAAQAARRLAQGAAWQHEAVVAEGGRFVDEHDVVPVLQFEVLQAVIEHEHVRAEFLNGMRAGLHAVLVHHDGNAGAVLCQHVGLVARVVRVQQHLFTVGDDARRRRRGLGMRPSFAASFFEKRHLLLALALVATAQDAHAAAMLVQRLGQHLDDGRLARAADGQVSHADDRHAEMVVMNVAMPV